MKKSTTTKMGQPFIYALFSLLIIFLLICMLSSPEKYMQIALAGISAWAFNVLPSVLPFMFFTKALSTLNFLPKLTKPLAPVSKKLFKTPPISIYTFIMAILSGYPVGSKMVADLYLQGKITKEEAFKMTSFCSTSGPMFIIGAVGIGMFHSAKIGYILFLSHLLGAILNGILFRNFKLKKSEEEQANTHIEKEENNQFNISELVLNSTLSILSVGCIITIFFIVIECFSPIFSLLPENVAFLLEGIVEITKGCIDLATLSSKSIATILCSFVISFGGISSLLQALSMLSKLHMPVKFFALQKFLHGVLSCLITAILLIFIPI